jgi:hypothetical protein
MRGTTCFALVLATALGGPGGGCGPAPPSNLSPTPDQDTNRHERAARYTQELARKNQQAERKVMGRITGSHSRK